jgi:hypothetical protein
MNRITLFARSANNNRIDEQLVRCRHIAFSNVLACCVVSRHFPRGYHHIRDADPQCQAFLAVPLGRQSVLT